MMIFRAIDLLLICAFLVAVSVSQAAGQSSVPATGSMAVAPARFELEMKPGTETTVVVNLDYRAGDEGTKPVRILATLNDWTITRDGRVEYFRAGTRDDSASPWVIYSPGEATVTPGTIHQIRVTISVPENAAPGDHLTALVIEQRPENLKPLENTRQMVVRYRMASVFYIKVPGLVRKGTIENLYAEATTEGIVVTPTLKNEGNSVIRPLSTVKVTDAEGKLVADVPESETLPVLANSASDQPITIGRNLPPGSYTVKYRVDFQDGRQITEGVTELVVKTQLQIARGSQNPKNP